MGHFCAFKGLFLNGGNFGGLLKFNIFLRCLKVLGERLILGPSLRSLTPPPPPGDPNFCCVCSVSVQVHSRFTFYKASNLSNTPRNFSCGFSVVVPVFIGT